MRKIYSWQKLGENYHRVTADLHFNGELIATDLAYTNNQDESARELTSYIHLYSTNSDVYLLVIRDLRECSVFICEDKQDIRRHVEENVLYYRKASVESFFDNIKKLFE